MSNFFHLNTIVTGILLFSGLLGACACLVIFLVIFVIVWRPRNAGIYPMKHWKPKYRSLGAPPPLPNYILYDDDHWDRDDFKGHKHTALTGTGVEGAEVASKFSHSLSLSLSLEYSIYLTSVHINYQSTAM